jgi:hypothetical protein
MEEIGVGDLVDAPPLILQVTPGSIVTMFFLQVPQAPRCVRG